MYRRVVPSVLQAYGVAWLSVGDAQKGYRNESYPVTLHDGRTINLIFFKREASILPRVRRADYVSDYAAVAGLPVRAREDARLLRVTRDRFAGLYNYLPGRTINWEAMTKRHIKLLGLAMGELHGALKDLESSDGFTIANEILPIINRMQVYFADPDVARAMHEKLGIKFDSRLFRSYEKIISHVSKLPGQQMLHMDMVRGNILFDEPRTDDIWQIEGLALTGVIDFEKACYGHPVFDLARTLAFLLVDSPKPPAKIVHYFLDSGYHKRAGQPLPDPRLLSPLLKLFLIHDFYKFLRHTPYESLDDNYHYVRTRDILQTYGMISSNIERGRST